MRSLLVCCFLSAVSANCYGQVVSYPSQTMSTPTVVGSTDTANVIPAGAVTPNYSSGVVPSSYSAVPATPATLPWYQTLTDKREHDFGTVARASKQVHVFEFENNTGSDLLLNNVRTSCGCTCLLYTSPSPRDRTRSRMPSSA